ncbi:hypothetical protein FACS18949_06660 [Clostridia bacterium]|nr:hypothetical protein FACS18949_06660 [Clostridia bacterium]
MRKTIAVLLALCLAATLAACKQTQTPEQFVRELLKDSALNSLSVSETQGVMLPKIPGLEVAEGDDIRYVGASWKLGETEQDNEIFILREDASGGWTVVSRYTDAYIAEAIQKEKERRDAEDTP